jgi:hypothetical protein
MTALEIKRRKLIWGSVTVIAFIFSAAMADGINLPTWEYVGNWKIIADRTDNTKGCFMTTGYQNRTYLRVGIDTVDQGIFSIYMMIGNPAWASLEVGKDYPLVVQFSNLTPWRAEGVAVDWNGIKVMLIPVITEKEVLSQLYNQSSIAFYYNDRLVDKLSLVDSRAAIDSMARCQQAVFNSSGSRNSPSRTSDPFVRSPDPFRQ